jgi:arginyl-tRNA synthetase
MNVFAAMLERVRAAAAALAAEGVLPAGLDLTRVTVEPLREPRDADFGDMTTNAALALAGEAGLTPRGLADAIAVPLRADPWVERAEVAGAGFVNITLRPAIWAQALRAALTDREAFGRPHTSAGLIAHESIMVKGLDPAAHALNEEDCVRFLRLLRPRDAAFALDRAKARQQSYDNPAFCVQYGHARAGAVFRQAQGAFPDLPISPEGRAELLRDAPLELLAEAGERALMRLIAEYPYVIETAALTGEPQRLAGYLHTLANAFHAHSCPGKATPHLRFIIQNDRRLTVARLALVEAVVIILAAGLGLLGVGAPDEIT